MEQSKVLTGILAGAAIGGVIALAIYKNRSLCAKSEDLGEDIVNRAKKEMRKGSRKLKSKFEEAVDKLDRATHKPMEG